MPNLEKHVTAFRAFIMSQGLSIFSEQAVNHGYQITVTDRAARIPVNFFTTGRITVQGKESPLKAQLTEWANLRQAGADQAAEDRSTITQNRHINRNSRYTVPPAEVETIRQTVIDPFPASVTYRSTTQEAEVYRAEIQRNSERVIVTQFKTGTLFVQGRSSLLFDDVCSAFDQRLMQSFADKAARFLPEEALSSTRPYLESAIAENDAWAWMRKELGQETFDFLWSHDQQLLLSGAGVLQAVEKTRSQIPDYCVVVMPFAKTFEGFATKLAVLLGLVTEEELRESADNIQVGRWLGKIEKYLPDPKRYEFVAHALNSAWHSRHKTIHADPQMPMPIRSLDEATGEIHSILRGMSKAHEVFVIRGIGLRFKEGQATTEESKRLAVDDNPKSTLGASAFRPTLANQNVERFEQVDTECLAAQLTADGQPVERQAPGSTTVWQIKGPDFEVFCSAKHPGRVTIRGLGAKEFAARYTILLQPKSSSISQDPDEELFSEVEAAVAPGWIGVDESGKGDVFGPLVVAGVFLTPDQVEPLIRLGVRDSKTLGETAIVRLSEQIKELCPHTIVRVIEPPEYNRLYEQFNNLNRLLAQQHADVITRLHEATAAPRAISDQFGDERLIRDELGARSCTIDLEQRPHAEDDLAVAAASILARAAFVSWLERTSQSIGFTIPPGVASITIEAGRQLVAKHGRKALGQYVKLHFRTVRAMH